MTNAQLPMKEFDTETGKISLDSENTTLDNASQFSFMSRSRIRKAFKNQTKKSITFFLGGIILIALILIFFGIPLLVNFTVLLDNTTDVRSETKSAADTYVPAPSLSSEFEATSSAKIVIEGSSEKEYSIKLYNGETEIDDINVGNNGRFKSTVTLKKGENHITAIAVSKSNNRSDESEKLVLHYLPEPPKLELTSPSDNQEFRGDRKFAEIRGSTSQNAKVTVNGSWAIMSGNGSFSYTLALKDGDNGINITATDPAKNKTEKNFIVKYSQ